MFGFLKKNKTLLRPMMKGEIIPIEDMPDQVFSQKILGEGFAVIPADGLVTSPIAGTVVQIFPTYHAFGILTKNNLEVLIHIGLDTVHLNGIGFKCMVEVNQEVQEGEALVEVDLDYIQKMGKSLISCVVITNSQRIKDISYHYGMNPRVAAEISIKENSDD